LKKRITHAPLTFPLASPIMDMSTGRSAAWLARLNGVQKVGSSNLPAPTIASGKVA
jgi:hypothetical protein